MTMSDSGKKYKQLTKLIVNKLTIFLNSCEFVKMVLDMYVVYCGYMRRLDNGQNSICHYCPCILRYYIIIFVFFLFVFVMLFCYVYLYSYLGVTKQVESTKLGHLIINL